eukprot:251501-Prymnesium_polylepis.1
MLVTGGSNVTIDNSEFISNTADVSGGALQVESGNVLFNQTLLDHNSAPTGGGRSIHLSHEGNVHYSLPARVGYWLLVSPGMSALHLPTGPVDTSFPFACPAGVVGGFTFPRARSPLGHHCPRATAEPFPCAAGEHQPQAGAGECRTCMVGQDSIAGAEQCTICAEHYYRPAADAPAALCSPCDAIPGARCGLNATVATLNLTNGYWRHSTATKDTHRC